MVLGKLRFAVVGTGHIAKQHVQALISCGQDLVGVCNRHLDKAMEFMQSFSGYEEVAPAAPSSPATKRSLRLRPTKRSSPIWA